MKRGRRKGIEWLLEELPKLKDEGVISSESTVALRAKYSAELEGMKPGVNLSVVFLGILGTLLIGGGIILVFAHNWDEWSRPMRAIISLLPLVLGIAVGAYTLLREKSMVWREGSAVFLCLSATAALGLICQTYNLGGNLASFLQVVLWMIMLLPLVFRSETAALGVLIAIASWAWARYENDSHTYLFWVYIIPVAYYYLRSSTVTSHAVRVFRWWICPVFLVVSFYPVIHPEEEEWVLCAFYALSVGMVIVGRWLIEREAWRPAEWPLKTLGTAGAVICGAIPMSHHIYDHVSFDGGSDIVRSLLLPLVVAGVSMAMLRCKERWFFCAFGVLPAIFAGLLLLMSDAAETAALVYAVVVGLIGILGIFHGSVQRDFYRLNLGLVMTAGAILSKFFDSDLPILARGLVFIAIGVGFLMINYLVMRRNKQNKSVQKEVRHA